MRKLWEGFDHTKLKPITPRKATVEELAKEELMKSVDKLSVNSNNNTIPKHAVTGICIHAVYKFMYAVGYGDIVDRLKRVLT